MPSLPQQLNAVSKLEGPLANVWAVLGRAWSQLVQTVNALSVTDTTANKPTTPALNHIWYTESDARGRSYIAVNGAWQGVRPVLEVIATASLPAASSSLDGLVVLEDAGAGDRNLIVYAGGQRFRLDGGAPF